ncbi:hypothetical protein G6F66_007047 [Rhizopus arrhizus]|nr:hypothetical protein G6F66_007047 [Rhizopus arrhizus]
MILDAMDLGITYCSYSLDQIACFLLLITEQLPVKTADADAGITLSPVFRFKELWEKFEKIPQNKKKGSIDCSAPMTLDEMRHKLVIEFPDFTFSKTTFYNRVLQHCALGLKRLKRLLEKRTSEEVKLKGKEAVLERTSDENTDLKKKSVFFDEASFNLHISCSQD